MNTLSTELSSLVVYVWKYFYQLFNKVVCLYVPYWSVDRMGQDFQFNYKGGQKSFQICFEDDSGNHQMLIRGVTGSKRQKCLIPAPQFYYRLDNYS